MWIRTIINSILNPKPKKQERELEIGAIYGTEDPFCTMRAKVLNIRNGYVQYEYIKTGGIYSGSLNHFNRLYSIKE